MKPKWGFLPSPASISKESATIKTKHCRFCMQRHLRQSAHLESYCPLDLYSGDEVRMKQALEGLCQSWMESDGKGNNLRFSVEGAVLLPSEVRCDLTYLLLLLMRHCTAYVARSPRPMSEHSAVDFDVDNPQNHRDDSSTDTQVVTSTLPSEASAILARSRRYRRSRQDILIVHRPIAR